MGAVLRAVRIESAFASGLPRRNSAPHPRSAPEMNIGASAVS
jgi:hypothetical protein